MITSEGYLNRLNQDIVDAQDRVNAVQFLFKKIETVEYDWISSFITIDKGQPVIHTYPDTVKIERCFFGAIELYIATSSTQYNVLEMYGKRPTQWNNLLDIAGLLGAKRVGRFELFLKQDEKWRERFLDLMTNDYNHEFGETNLYENFRMWEEMIDFQELLEDSVPASSKPKKKTKQKI